MIQILVLSSVVAVSFARQNLRGSDNVATVPTNCPPGQEWINGMCKDVWRNRVTPLSGLWTDPAPGLSNAITVPPNCPAGQQHVNGLCRDVWRDAANSNLHNGLLGSLWSEHVNKLQQSPSNLINKPINLSQCPIGYQPDAFGNCYPIP